MTTWKNEITLHIEKKINNLKQKVKPKTIQYYNKTMSP